MPHLLKTTDLGHNNNIIIIISEESDLRLGAQGIFYAQHHVTYLSTFNTVRRADGTRLPWLRASYLSSEF